jgi:ketosteroid isomerase-like protein
MACEFQHADYAISTDQDRIGLPAARRLISKKSVVAVALAVTVAACASSPRTVEPEAARAQVFATERAFARTMADRDIKAFATFISEEAVFVSGAKSLRGKAKVVEAWGRYFVGPSAPFSWEPDAIEVSESGSLAVSSGPVRDPDGKLAARFSSVWRLEPPGVWRIVLDRGDAVCPKEGAQ